MNQPDFEEEVLIEKRGPFGVITMNRPQALNAITLEMIRQMSGALYAWEEDLKIKAVFFQGAGDRAFSAGGDLKLFHRAGMDVRKGHVVSKVPAIFFQEEYSLNRQIFHFPKPTIAFMDGIVMGGGFGIGGNCAHRIATPRTVFAMPETGIGFFPDVGSVYHLLRCPKSAGRYFALTGEKVRAQDTVHAGIAEYFIGGANAAAILTAIEKSDFGSYGIKAALGMIAEKTVPSGPFQADMDKIDMTFRIPNVHALFAVLQKDVSEWAQAALATMKKRAPASVLVTAAHMNRSVGKSFNEVIAEDFTLAQRFLERMDLYEGIRAALIDRDYEPQWDPPTYEEITEDMIRAYFDPTDFQMSEVRDPISGVSC